MECLLLCAIYRLIEPRRIVSTSQNQLILFQQYQKCHSLENSLALGLDELFLFHAGVLQRWASDAWCWLRAALKNDEQRLFYQIVLHHCSVPSLCEHSDGRCSISQTSRCLGDLLLSEWRVLPLGDGCLWRFILAVLILWQECFVDQRSAKLSVLFQSVRRPRLFWNCTLIGRPLKKKCLKCFQMRYHFG